MKKNRNQVIGSSDDTKDLKVLADINEISVDKSLPKQERIAEYMRQIKDPYCFKCGKFIVKARFAEDGVTLEECIRGILL